MMNTTKIKSFREKLSVEPSVGIFSKSTDPAFVEAAAYGGMEFIILDMEHGPSDFKTIENLVRGIDFTDAFSMVRVPANEPWMISKALDTGAMGVQVPNIGSLREAEKAIRSARFYPLGNRGVCRFVRAAEYARIEKNQYFTQSNQTLLCLMVEGSAGLTEIDEILQLDGFDVLFIGPYDLSQSLGIPGDIYNERISGVLKELSTKAKKFGKVLGTFYDERSKYNWFVEAGINYLAYSVDVEIFRRACLEISKGR